jgi:hypothetical protein
MLETNHVIENRSTNYWSAFCTKQWRHTRHYWNWMSDARSSLPLSFAADSDCFPWLIDNDDARYRTVCKMNLDLSKSNPYPSLAEGDVLDKRMRARKYCVRGRQLVFCYPVMTPSGFFRSTQIFPLVNKFLVFKINSYMFRLLYKSHQVN